jgi:FkbM family methyltransferase
LKEFRGAYYDFNKEYKMFIIRIILSFLRKKEFIKLNNFGKHIYYYDSNKKHVFRLFAPRSIDKVTCDEIFQEYIYNLKGLNRYDELMGVYNNQLKQGRVPYILDLGSNIGCAAYQFNKMFPDALIDMIEPDVLNNQVAKLNCSTENFKIRTAAIGPRKGVCRITNLDSDSNAFQIDYHEKGLIPVLTVHELIQSNKLYAPFICKIDIEGFESKLFSSNFSWVKQFPLIILESHDWLYPKKHISRNFLKAINEHSRDLIVNKSIIFSLLN